MLPSLARAREWTDAEVDVTLIDPQRWLYYSGMVPEYLGGVYELDDIRIDLRRMAHEAGATHLEAEATAIDPEARVVSTADGSVPFDVLAVDVGGVNPSVPDAAVGPKPISRIRALAPRLERVLDDPTARLDLVVVGGGAAGVEVALNLTGRFAGAGRTADLSLTLIEQADQILSGFPEGLRGDAARLLRGRGARIRTATTVEAVASGNGEKIRVDTTTEGDEALTLRPGAVLWATGAVGPALLRESGLVTDERGFLHVARSLRTPTHPRIFAAGDCATIPALGLDKVGVHAVKQGPLLYTNLDRTLRRLRRDGAVPATSDLRPFRPYPVAPLVLSTGAPQAFWTAGPFWARHAWLLRLKHWIDRRWIRAYAPDRWGNADWWTLIGAEAASTGGAPANDSRQQPDSSF